MSVSNFTAGSRTHGTSVGAKEVVLHVQEVLGRRTSLKFLLLLLVMFTHALSTRVSSLFHLQCLILNSVTSNRSHKLQAFS